MLPRRTAVPPPRTRSFSAAMTVLRVVTGLAWFSNGLAKALTVPRIDVGWFRAGLIDIDSAHSILQRATTTTTFAPLAALYGWVAGPPWPVFSVLLTTTELAVGVGLLLGVFPRVAASVAILLIGPIWVMTWPSGTYLWDYPGDLVPLLVLVLAPPTRGILPRRSAPRPARPA